MYQPRPAPLRLPLPCSATWLALPLLAFSLSASAINISWSGNGADGNWSNVQNWADGAVPQALDFARFGPGSARTGVVADSVIVAGIDLLAGANGFEIGGSSLAVDERIAAEGGAGTSNRVAVKLDFTGGGVTSKLVTVSSGQLSLSGGIGLPGALRRVDMGVSAGAVLEVGQITGQALLTYFYGAGVTRLLGTSTFDSPVLAQSGHAVVVQNGVVLTSPQSWELYDASLVLESGTGVLSPLTVHSGGRLWLRPEGGRGAAAVNTLVLEADATLLYEVASDGSRPGLDVLGITSPVLQQPTLQFYLPGHVATSAGDSYTLIAPQQPVTGSFAGLPEGAAFVAGNGRNFTISYRGGANARDVVVTDSPVVGVHLRRLQPAGSLAAWADGQMLEFAVEVDNPTLQTIAPVVLDARALSGLGQPLWDCVAAGSACTPASGSGRAQTTVASLAGATAATLSLNGSLHRGDRFVEIAAEIQLGVETRSLRLLESLTVDGIFRGGME